MCDTGSDCAALSVNKSEDAARRVCQIMQRARLKGQTCVCELLHIKTLVEIESSTRVELCVSILYSEHPYIVNAQGITGVDMRARTAVNAAYFAMTGQTGCL